MHLLFRVNVKVRARSVICSSKSLLWGTSWHASFLCLVGTWKQSILEVWWTHVTVSRYFLMMWRWENLDLVDLGVFRPLGLTVTMNSQELCWSKSNNRLSTKIGWHDIEIFMSNLFLRKISCLRWNYRRFHNFKVEKHMTHEHLLPLPNW